MKKIIAILLSSLALILCACGQDGDTIGVEQSSAPTFEKSYSEEERGSLQLLEYSRGYANLSLLLPEGWEGEVIECSEMSGQFGIEFWHSDHPDERLKLHWYDDMFGVCGTGLVETEGELPGGEKYRVGCYDGRDTPDFISFYDSPGGYALINGADAVWMEHREELEKILCSITLDQGVIRRSQAESIAKESVVVSYDYIRTEFDPESGSWTLSFTRSGGELVGVVTLDTAGNIIE